MTSEVWKPVVGFEGYYEVSDLGRVRNTSDQYVRSLSINSEGYYHVPLFVEGHRTNMRVNIMVCEAFNGPAFPGAKALHKDDNKSNNTPDNLYWGTQKQNAEDRHRNGGTKFGERHPRAKLTWDIVREVRKLYADGMKPAHIADKFDIPGPNVHAIIRNKMWPEEARP